MSAPDPHAVVSWRKRIRHHLQTIHDESWCSPDPVDWDPEGIDDVSLDDLAARLIADGLPRDGWSSQ